MQYSRYGITLQPLDEKHLEMVRQWRNSDLVRLRMYFQEIITEEAQANWFAGLNRQNNFYFIGFRSGMPFGVFNIKNIDWETRSGEAGAFVGHSRFIGSPDAAFAILALMDFAFFELGLKMLEAKYNPRFREIDTLNRRLGYETVADEADGFVRGRVSADRYILVTASIRKAAEKLSSYLPSS